MSNVRTKHRLRSARRVRTRQPTLRALRAAIGRAWRGGSAVEEIRAQRMKSYDDAVRTR